MENIKAYKRDKSAKGYKRYLHLSLVLYFPRMQLVAGALEMNLGT